MSFITKEVTLETCRDFGEEEPLLDLISGDPLIPPVYKTPQGTCYSRESLQGWLRTSRTDPLTRASLIPHEDFDMRVAVRHPYARRPPPLLPRPAVGRVYATITALRDIMASAATDDAIDAAFMDYAGTLDACYIGNDSYHFLEAYEAVRGEPYIVSFRTMLKLVETGCVNTVASVLWRQSNFTQTQIAEMIELNESMRRTDLPRHRGDPNNTLGYYLRYASERANEGTVRL